MDTGHIMIRSSSMTLSTRNTKYRMNMVNPNALFIFHLQAAMEIMTKRSMRKSSTMAQNSPLLLTVTGANEWQTEYISQGTGSL